MVETVFRFLQLDVMTDHAFIPWAILIIWISLLFAASSSLKALDISPATRVSWGFFIVLIPFIGLAAYALRCLLKADWSFTKPFFRTKSQSIRAFEKTPSMRTPQ